MNCQIINLWNTQTDFCRGTSFSRKHHRQIHRGSKSRQQREQTKYDINVSLSFLGVSRVSWRNQEHTLCRRINKISLQFLHQCSLKGKVRAQVHYHKVHPTRLNFHDTAKSANQALFVGANIDVINIQLLDVPSSRECKSSTKSLKRCRRFIKT